MGVGVPGKKFRCGRSRPLVCYALGWVTGGEWLGAIRGFYNWRSCPLGGLGFRNMVEVLGVLDYGVGVNGGGSGCGLVVVWLWFGWGCWAG